MTGPDILTKPVRVDLRGERLYFHVPGEVCVDVCSGLHEDRARVLALLAQVQRAFRVLAEINQDLTVTQPWSGEVESVLCDARVLSDDNVPSEGT